jgi:hypothetical protein
MLYEDFYLKASVEKKISGSEPQEDLPKDQMIGDKPQL